MNTQTSNHAQTNHNLQSINDILKNHESYIDTIITIRGWVRNRRDSKAGFSFITVSDGSTFSALQIVASNDLANYTTEVLKLTKDCSVAITGKLINSLGDNQSVELVANVVTVIGLVENPDTYPVSAKRHTVEYLRDVAHLRVRTNLISAVMRVRNTVSYSIHKYLQNLGFYWIHTPIITGTDCEGAGEMFRVSVDNSKEEFFGKPAYLTVSGQLNLETYCMGLSKVYTFGPTFRAEKSNTTRHLAEFWMVEPEIAFANLMDDAKLAEDLLRSVFRDVLNLHQEEMQFFNKFINQDVISRLTHVVDNNFELLSYTDAINHLLKTNKKFENPVVWGMDLASEHERFLCETIIGRPTIVTDYPKEIKAFYMRQNDDGKTVAAMDILAPGVGEIVGGSAREERYDVLIDKMRALGLSQEELSWYLDLRKFGSVPHAGFGVGLERLVSYITGVQNIRDVIPYPRSVNNITF